MKSLQSGIVTAKRALYIKLGEGGDWEAECIASGTLRFGYHRIPHDRCVAGDWKAAENALHQTSADQGAVTRHLNQVKEFYTAASDVLWVTFHSDRLWWCFSEPQISVHDMSSGAQESQGQNAEKTRPAIEKWSDRDINGQPLIKGKLSGKLLALQMFQGTICTVRELDYLLHKINGTVEPHVAAAQAAFEQLQTALVPIIRSLQPKDLEILVDLIFRQSGWQRVGVAGGNEKDIDLDLISPVTSERIAVQVKSKAKRADWRAYKDKFADMQGFARFYFVTHTSDSAFESWVKDDADESFVFWGIDHLATQAVRGGLTGWLLDKAS